MEAVQTDWGYSSYTLLALRGQLFLGSMGVLQGVVPVPTSPWRQSVHHLFMCYSKASSMYPSSIISEYLIITFELHIWITSMNHIYEPHMNHHRIRRIINDVHPSDQHFGVFHLWQCTPGCQIPFGRSTSWATSWSFGHATGMHGAPCEWDACYPWWGTSHWLALQNGMIVLTWGKIWSISSLQSPLDVPSNQSVDCGIPISGWWQWVHVDSWDQQQSCCHLDEEFCMDLQCARKAHCHDLRDSVKHLITTSGHDMFLSFLLFGMWHLEPQI